ncbi:MAG: transporter substrate-binding protein [Synechococcales bacterium]|nr:transporter substrate-binding protein [Synechococcales bacterium]
MRSLDRSAQKYPIISNSILEEEVQAIGIRYFQNHFSVSNYFQSLNHPANTAFIQAFRKKYGKRRLLNAPMASAYSAVYLWKAAVEKAQSFNPTKVRQAARGLMFDSPMGQVRMNVNHHLSLPCLIGRIRADGLFDIVYHSKTAIAPQPWNPAIAATKGYACDWSDPKRGGKYRGSIDSNVG